MRPDDSDPFVTIPVPARHYALVLRSLADALAAEVPGAETPPLRQPGERGWSKPEIAELARSGNRMTKSILNLGSQRPGKPVSIRDAEKAAGVGRGSARGQLAGLSQLTRRRFGRRDWPFKMVWAAGGESQAYYVVSAEVAGLWNEVRS